MIIIEVHSNYFVLNKDGNMFNGVGDVSVKDFLEQMIALKEFGSENGIMFKTSKEPNDSEPDGYMFIDLPKSADKYLKSVMQRGKPLFLMAWESGIINPRNFQHDLHKPFQKVFTYADDMVDNNKYFKIAYSFELPTTIPKAFNTKKFCCLIAGNKSSTHPNELYSKRIELIKWFEMNHPDELDLYGQGWTKIIPAKNLFDRVINRFPYLHSRLKPRYQSYKGVVADKLKVYEQYKFAICYENAKDLTGYISEKIFDCLFSGCVPVYWGAPNIAGFIPEECFIDRRKFSSIESLYNFMRSISEEEYFKYLLAIEKFLKTEQKGVFSIDYFKTTIVRNIADTLAHSKNHQNA
jgi:alpha(1,3/1,4) fucosyltransferase